MAKYDAQLELTVVEQYLGGHEGFTIVGSKFWADPSTLRDWVQRYHRHGSAGLQRKGASYDVAFKQKVLERMQREQWSLGQTAVFFGIRCASHVGYAFGNGFYVSGDAKYTSGYGARFGISPQDTIDSRVIVNLQAGYRQENWEVQVFAENLFDKRYYTFIDRDAAPIYAQLGARRAVGATVTLRY